MDHLLQKLHTDTLWIRFFLTAVLLAPGSFFMGMPFPTVMRTMGSHERPLVPWAWAINAFTSVAASVLTVYLAMQFGFHKVLFFGAASYLIAMLVYFFRLMGIKTQAGRGAQTASAGQS